METSIVLALLAVLLGLGALYIWAVAWAIGDAQKRGQTGCLPIFLFYLFGPLAVAAWLVVRPRNRLTDKQFDEYLNPEDAFAAASRLDTLGEWDAAVVLYRTTGQRWPEHQSYAERCIEQIERKQITS